MAKSLASRVNGSLRALLATTLTSLMLSALAVAQTASIKGTVTDTTGAVVVGAEVTARELDTNATRTATTGDTGAYAITNLPVGRYDISVNKSGFRTFKVEQVVLTVDQALTANAKLQTGGATEEVQVLGNELPPVDLDTAQLSNLVDSREIQDLPLITRDPYSLVLLSPGTSQTDSSHGGFSVNGARDRNNNFLLDGVDNNDTSVPGGPDGVLAANPDSTQEFRVITDNFNAEFGRNTGAIIDVITKSGSNAFHGGVYEYGRWNGFGGARDWFNPGTGPNAGPMNPYVRNQFGYSIGGPIIKNKTFFFFNEEFQRFRTTLTNQATVPTAAFKTGKFNYTYTDPNTGQSNTIPVDLTPTGANNATGAPEDPTMQKVFALYPNPTTPSTDGIEGNLFFPSTSAQNAYNATAKIDQHFSDKEILSLRYGYDHFFDPNPAHSDILPGIGAYEEKAINQGLAAQLTSTLSNTLVNNFQFGWNRVYGAFYLSPQNISILDSPGGVDSFGNGRDYLMDPFTSFGSLALAANGQARRTGTTSYTDNITWAHGRHTFKYGFDFRDVGESGFDDFFSRRQVNMEGDLLFGFNAGMLQNIPSGGQGASLVDAAGAYYGLVIEDTESQFFNKGGDRQATDNKNFRQHEYDWYGQDTWKVRPNLTLNLGLRYQLNSVPYEEGANFSNLLQNPATFNFGQAVTFSLVGPGTGHSLYQPDYKDIEPRIGLSWDPIGDGKTAVRAGFGIFHDRVFGNAFGNARADPPFQSSYTNFPVETINNFFGSGGFPTVIPTQTPSASIADGTAASGIVIFDPHFPNPESNNWNLDIQRELGGNNVFEVAYVGSMGIHVYGQIDGNSPDPARVQHLVQYCDNPANAFGCTSIGTQTQPATVSSSSLYIGATPSQGFNDLPFNAVMNNALFQPDYQMDEFNSIYEGLQTKFTHRMSHGLQIQGAYTWSHAIDNSVDPLGSAVGAHSFPRNSRDLAQGFGNSDNDTRHVAVFNYIWELPLGKGKSYLSNGALGKVLEGMQFSGITTIQSGHPFQVRGTEDTQRTGIAAWASQVGDPFGAPSSPSCAPSPALGKIYITNQCAFVNPPWGSAGSTGRNEFYGPGFWDFDLAFAKKMQLTERFGLELRFEGYNVFNHPHFLNPGTDGAGVGNLIQNPLFGVLTNTYTEPDGTTSARQIQVALRLNF